MHIRDLEIAPVKITLPAPDSLLVVKLHSRTVDATEYVNDWENQVLSQAAPVLSCSNPAEQQVAVAAQAELARYVKAVHAAAEAAKKPLNEIRAKIIALDKELVTKVESEGARIGGLIAEFQIAEQNRVAALRRLQEAQTSKTVQEMDQKLSEAGSLDEQDQIRDQYREQLAAESPPVEPIRAKGQVVKEELEVQVFDIWLLARSMPSCVRVEPILSEIKSLVRAGIKVPGVTVTKKVVAGVRLAPTPTAIEV